MSSLAGRRDLTLMAVGLAVSTAGDAAALIALLLRLRPAGSGWVAALLAVELLPAVLLATLAGAVVDRHESHRVLVLALGGQAVVAVPLALVDAPWATVVLFAGLSAFSVFVRPATSALVPVIAGEEQAARGYARLASGNSLGFIVGPVLGGVVTATIGGRAALLIDAASFAALTGAALLVRARRRPAHDGAGARGDKRGGFALIRHSRVLRTALLASAVAIACAVVDNVAAPYRFVDQLGASSTVYGAYLTLWGAGAFVGVQLLPRLSRLRSETALAGGNLLIGLGIAGIGLAGDVSTALVAAVAGGVGNGVANVAQSALVAEHSPATHRGRVFASAGAIVQVAVGTGTIVAAPLVSVLHADRAMVLAGTVAAVLAAFGLLLSRRPAVTVPAD